MKSDKDKPKESLIFCPWCGTIILFKEAIITKCPKCKKGIGPFFHDNYDNGDDSNWENEGGKPKE